MHIESIRNCISNEDVVIAESLGYSPKLIGLAENNTDGVRLHMAPALVHRDSSLGNVNGVLNGVVLEGDMVGTLTLVGAGAGRDTTASAVLGDIADVMSGGEKTVFNQSVYKLVEKPVLSMNSRCGTYYLRSSLDNNTLKKLLASKDVKVLKIITDNDDSVAIIDRVMEEKIKDVVKDTVKTLIRIEEC